MKLIKKCPLFILLISTVLLLTIVGIAGKLNVYAELNFDPLRTPALALVFTGWNEEIYPWQIWEQSRGKTEAESEQQGETESEQEAPEQQGETQAAALPSGSVSDLPSDPRPSAEAESPAPSLTPEEAGEQEGMGRLEPLRESTQEEYLNHISADIYGDAGVLRAAEYEFATVEESYFDDALFIGDSRTVGLLDYTTLAEHADFYCETSLTIYKVLEENFKGKGTISDALAQKDYGKIYIMVGINELGRGTTEDFMSQYTEVIDTLHELEPDALIFIQGIMRVSGSKNSSDAIFNNSNINARNNAIATLADNEQIFYIDVNEAICDEEGNLLEEYTFDQIHLLGKYNDLWKQFLLEHGVPDSN